MILASHAILGAAIGRLAPQNLYAAFILGFLSHFITDSIPHWHYPLKSIVKDGEGKAMDMLWGKNSILDFLKIGLDIISGIIILFLLFKPQNTMEIKVLLAGAIGGILPDGLQFLQFKIKKWRFPFVTKLHRAFHAKQSIKNTFWGLLFQIAIVGVVSAISIFILKP